MFNYISSFKYLTFLTFFCRRTSGGRGFISGAGETELQLQRRRLFLDILNDVSFFHTSFDSRLISRNVA